MGAIFKNSSYLLGAQLFTKVISFFYALFLARNLAVEEFGLYTLALSFFSLVSSFGELGINRYLTREVAISSNSQKKVASLLCSVTLLRLCLVSLIFALFALFIKVTDPNQMRVFLTLLAVSAILPQAIAFTLDSVFVGAQKFLWSSFGVLVLNSATVLVGVLLMNQGYGVLGATAAVVLGQIIYCITLFLFPMKMSIKYIKNNLSKENAFSQSVLKEIIQGSLPYGILGVLGLIYFKIDTVILAYLKGSYEVGIYGAAYKFLEAIVFIPSSVAVVLFPILAKLHLSDKEQVKEIYFKAMKTLLIVSIIVTIAFIFVLPMVITTFLPSYQNSIAVIKILSLAIPFIFVHVPGALVLLSSNKYLKPVILLSIGTVSFNIIANLLFVPLYGYSAAAVVTVLSEILSFVVFFVFLQRKVFQNKVF